MIDDSDSDFFTFLGLLYNAHRRRSERRLLTTPACVLSWQSSLRSHDPILIAAGVGLMLWAAMLGWTVWFIILRR